MGLDLILYKKNKNQNIEDMSMEEELDSELAYGRKTWAIADFFRRRCTPIYEDCEYIVAEQDWHEFIDSLEELADVEFRDRLNFFLEMEYDENVDDELYKKEYIYFEKWLDISLDNDAPYTLGLEWELAAVMRWYDADDEVQEAFDNDDEEVRLIVSY
jgi:hypothetical protein